MTVTYFALAGAVCTLKEVRDMCSEMLEAQRPWLPDFDGRAVRDVPTVEIPEDCKPAQVPLDPALAIVNRFSTLLERETE